MDRHTAYFAELDRYTTALRAAVEAALRIDREQVTGFAGDSDDVEEARKALRAARADWETAIASAPTNTAPGRAAAIEGRRQWGHLLASAGTASAWLTTARAAPAGEGLDLVEARLVSIAREKRWAELEAAADLAARSGMGSTFQAGAADVARARLNVIRRSIGLAVPEGARAASDHSDVKAARTAFLATGLMPHEAQ